MIYAELRPSTVAEDEPNSTLWCEFKFRNENSHKSLVSVSNLKSHLCDLGTEPELLIGGGGLCRRKMGGPVKKKKVQQNFFFFFQIWGGGGGMAPAGPLPRSIIAYVPRGSSQTIVIRIEEVSMFPPLMPFLCDLQRIDATIDTPK